MNDTCTRCGQPLYGGTLVHPWEDGDNPRAYIICPNCHKKNEQDGFGEDD